MTVLLPTEGAAVVSDCGEPQTGQHTSRVSLSHDRILLSHIDFCKNVPAFCNKVWTMISAIRSAWRDISLLM